MRLTSWRVTRRRFASRAFDGEGSRLWGGRWNSRGLPAVYTSATTSLALLETLVHADVGLHQLYVTIPVNFDAELVSTVEAGVLPSSWRALPIPFEVQQIGDLWLASGRSCVLEVPSVVVPHESNFIFNPGHPDFGALEIGAPIELEVDTRLV